VASSAHECLRDSSKDSASRDLPLRHCWQSGCGMPSRLVLVGALLSQHCSVAAMEDENPFCADWAASGECTRNPGFMNEKCARSCSSPFGEQSSKTAVEPSPAQESSEFPDDVLHPLSESAGSAADGTARADLSTVEAGRPQVEASQEPRSVSTPEDTMARLALQVRSAPPEPSVLAQPSRDHLTEIGGFDPNSYTPPAPKAWVPEGSVHETEFAESASDVMEIEDSQALADDDNLLEAQLKARLQRCLKDDDDRVTEARMSNFYELASSHDKDVKDALKKQQREFDEQMWTVKRQHSRKEAELHAHFKEATRRMEEAEHRYNHIQSGEQHRQALERARQLERNLADEEQTRLSLEKQIREKLTLAAEREKKLEEGLETWKTRAELAESTVARLRRQLWLRRRQLTKKPPSNQLASEETNSSAPDADFNSQCLMDDSVVVGVGICKKGKSSSSQALEEDAARQEDVGHQSELPALKLRESIMGAMQILSPAQDVAIWHMHSDLCLAQSRGTTDPCSVSSVFNVTSWMAAFAWVALWRCVWVLSIRYFITCSVSFAERLAPVWDSFSDWFCGFRSRSKHELATQDL